METDYARMEKELKSRHINIKFPVLGEYRVRVVVTSDLKKSLEQHGIPADADDNSTYAMAVHEDGTGYSAIFLPYGANISSVVHESWHVIRRMMEYLGIELDNETVAYHLGYLTEKVYNFLRKGK